jgi:hypothetical protein
MPNSSKVQCHAEAVGQRTHAPLFIVQPGKKQGPGDRREQENPVVKMMHMSVTHVKKQVRRTPGHDQNHQRPRRDKCEKKRDQRQPGQVSRWLWRQDLWLRHNSTVNHYPRFSLSVFGISPYRLAKHEDAICRKDKIALRHFTPAIGRFLAADVISYD